MPLEERKMDQILVYVGWVLYGIAILAAPTHTTRLIYSGQENDAPKTWWSKILCVAFMFPVMGGLLFGIGWIMMWVGKIMIAPFHHLWTRIQ